MTTMRSLCAQMARIGRRYVDCRKPITFLGRSIRTRRECEHCDGESSLLVRDDGLRGWVCPVCDSALDEMMGEGTYPENSDDECQTSETDASSVKGNEP